MKGLIGLFAVVLTSGFVCTDTDLKYIFSPCARNRTRGVFFYWEKDCEQGNLPSPIWTLPCDFPCPAGTFLGLNQHRNASGCELCPSDTFSPGGSDRVEAGDWVTGQGKFFSYCSKLASDWVTWEEAECSRWTADLAGEYILSGRTNESTWVQTELAYFANLTIAGSLLLRYSKNSKQMGNFNNGIFEIVVNDRVALLDNTQHREEWKTVNIDLQPGANEITMRFRKFNDKNHYNSGIKLAYFEVTNVFPSAHFCLPCTKGVSSKGAITCQICAENTYLDTNGPKHMCIPCPDTHYSTAGSVGMDACILKPACGNADYSSRLSPCSEGFRTMDYYWKQPVRCDISSGNLPAPVLNLPCEVCNAGYYHKPISETSLEMECSQCPAGSALIEQHLNDTCAVCPAGTYAQSALNITHWLPFPIAFKPTQQPDVCRAYPGWTAYNSQFLISNATVRSRACSFVLERNVNVTESGTVQFEVLFFNGPESQSWLSFEVNDQVFATFRENLTKSTFTVHLDPGLAVLRWTHYQEADSSSSAIIYSLLITGTEEGGAAFCQPCPSRRYSTISSSKCEECAPGYTHTQNHTDCQRCPINMISGSQDCENCPFNTVANSEQTMCIGLDYLEWGYIGFNISRLTGRNRPNICANSPRLSLLCSGNVYGPVPAGDGSSFYLSVLNPGDMSKLPYAKAQNSIFSYAWGLFPRETSPNGPKKAIETDSILASLGTKIEEIEQTSLGFTIKYAQGANCPSSNLLFSSEIAFICDKSEGDGWPQLTSQHLCTYMFTWRTKLACRQCQEAELEVIKGRCEENTRQIQYIEPDFCLYFPNSTTQIVEMDCIEAFDFTSTWLALLGLALIVGLIGAVALLAYKLCNVQQRYQLLLRESDPRPDKDL